MVEAELMHCPFPCPSPLNIADAVARQVVIRPVFAGHMARFNSEQFCEIPKLLLGKFWFHILSSFCNPFHSMSMQ